MVACAVAGWDEKHTWSGYGSQDSHSGIIMEARVMPIAVMGEVSSAQVAYVELAEAPYMQDRAITLHRIQFVESSWTISS